MIAVRVTREMRLAVVGSPQYFKSHNVPRKPQDLKEGIISEGRLIQVLKDWCPTFQGYFLYYPSRRNQPATLSALIDTLRLSD
jgi:hypothetical protein